jgi:subtilisin family serine protease
MRSSVIFALAAIPALTLQGCHDQRAPTESGPRGTLAASVTPADQTSRHIIVFAAERVPADFGLRVSGLGGSLETALDSIGVVVVTGLAEAAVAELTAQPDIRNVEPDVVTTLPDDDVEAADDGTTSEALAPADATTSPTSAQFYPRQWNMRAVFADQAWAAGHLGSRDVVVAILDGGIDYLHPDLVGLVDLERSKSFASEDDPVVAERFPGRLPITDLHGHGTAVASIVASNARFFAGVNREVTLLAVKIFNRTNQGSPFSRWLVAIVYAADQGADVMNLSAARTFDKSENPGIIVAFERAANYAFRKGALLVSVPGNDAVDLDHNGDTVRLPCEAANAICVSATGPTGVSGVNGPWENVDAPAPYTAFGRSAVDVAAPGGAGDPANQTQFRRVWVPCTTTPTETSLPACARGMPIAQPFGTSLAAPHISGLAALLVAQLGHGKPALIRARILESADDLGDPGVDPFYGHGRINIARALGVIE